MLTIYNLIYNIFFVPVIYILGIFSKKIRAGKKEKFGNYGFKFLNRTIWIHAVSVGEVMLASTLIDKMGDFKYDIVLTTSTPQGQELAKNKLKDKCKMITYFPYDTKYAINRAIDAINPEMAIIIETEIWPNFAKRMKELAIPLFIVNGRISERTYKSYKKLSFFFKEVLKNYAGILAQSEDDAKRFIDIGADKNRVAVSGNIKFDLKTPEEYIKHKYRLLFKTFNKNVLVFASTHGEENSGLIDTYRDLKNSVADLKLIIAPRHLEKVPQIEKILDSKLLKWGKRSSNASFDDNDVIILDTTGELGSVYSAADVCVICGSFNNTGGHNPLEATVWGKPAITGPNIKNFRQIYKSLCELNCAFKVKNYTQLKEKIFELFSDRNYMEKVKSGCICAMEKNRGATNFTIKYLKEFNGEKYERD